MDLRKILNDAIYNLSEGTTGSLEADNELGEKGVKKVEDEQKKSLGISPAIEKGKEMVAAGVEKGKEMAATASEKAGEVADSVKKTGKELARGNIVTGKQIGRAHV